MSYSGRYNQAKRKAGKQAYRPMRGYTRRQYISHQNLDRDRTIATNITNITHSFNKIPGHRLTIVTRYLLQNGIGLTAKDILHGDCWSRLLAVSTPLRPLPQLYEQVEAMM
jgi:hypothetical protein